LVKTTRDRAGVNTKREKTTVWRRDNPELKKSGLREFRVLGESTAKPKAGQKKGSDNKEGKGKELAGLKKAVGVENASENQNPVK